MNNDILSYNNDDINILIVEDEIILAMAIELSLKKMGYYVSGIESIPKEVIIHVHNFQPDIILMDINLNDKETGIDLANKIWKKYKIPIIFLTSYSNDATIKAAMESEPYGYLIKPCRDEEIKAAVSMAIHKHRFFFKNKESFIVSEDDCLYLEDDLKFNKTTSSLLRDDTKISLTKNEKKLFEIITKNPGEVVSFKMIYAYIWREDLYDLSKLRSLIYRLRTKLKINPFENMYEQGYKIKVVK
jgi:DNA-binding response OmpR family regulator